MIIQPIVEGYGEVQAIPILLRRFIAESGFYDIQIAPPFRRKRFELVRHDDVHRLVNLSLAREGCQGVMFIFDADDDCPKVKAPEIKRWAEEAANNRAACEVVMANREYEAWFLAAVTSMKGKGAVKEDAEYDGDCEVVRDAKGAFERLLRHAYHAPTDQPMYSEMLDLSSAFQRSRSFRRMVHAFANLAESDGKCCHYPPEWVNCEGPR